jgi:enterochelin esterase-like enzyme
LQYRLDHDTDRLESRVDKTAQEESARPRPRTSHIAVLVTATVLVFLAIFLGVQHWAGPGRSAIATDLLEVQILSGPVPIIVNLLAVVALVFLFLRRPSRRRVIAAAIGLGAGVLVALAVLWWVGSTNAFGVYVGKTITLWVVASFAGSGLAVATFWSAEWFRKLGAAVSIVLFAITATLGINTYFGLDPTVGDLAGISVQASIHLPVGGGSTGQPPGSQPSALWKSWTPVAGMPTKGQVGSVIIPNTHSRFVARPAGLYLPPAALVPNPPALPLVIMMMGQPGNPDPGLIASTLDRFAARHSGLAPIVIVADQIGNPLVDTFCLNSKKYGNVETYITKDVVGWARSNLHIENSPAEWTIAGYSNGGECAAYFGAKYPGIWGNVIDVSGEAYAGSDEPKTVVAQVFHGDWAAYEKTWPVGILGTKRYPDSVGVFTVASDDLAYKVQAAAVARAAKSAHWRSTYYEVHDGGHGAVALVGGLNEAFTVLYPRLGLAAQH